MYRHRSLRMLRRPFWPFPSADPQLDLFQKCQMIVLKSWKCVSSDNGGEADCVLSMFLGHPELSDKTFVPHHVFCTGGRDRK